jgi:hypothetical protein
MKIRTRLDAMTSEDIQALLTRIERDANEHKARESRTEQLLGAFRAGTLTRKQMRVLSK